MNKSFKDYVSGCSVSNVDASNETICVEYNTVNGVKASTTHNIYGVYDMSGGSYENVMACYNNLYIGLNSVESKYMTRYAMQESEFHNGVGMGYDPSIYGDAVYETSFDGYRYGGVPIGNTLNSWHSDRSYFPYINYPCFHRGKT